MSTHPDLLFETGRLAVRRLRRSDLPALLAVYGDLDAMRWVGDGSALTALDAHRWLDVTERNVATRGYGMCTLTRRSDGAVIGFCGLVHPGGQPLPEIKYALARAHWGQGLATEAARGLLDWGTRCCGLRHIIATTAPDNSASHRVLRKAGMRDAAPRRDDDGSTTQLFEWRAPRHPLFVYGTLKQGFCNFHVNRGRRLPGEFMTVQPFPLYVIGEIGLPWLVYEPGRGLQVTGQLFEVDDDALAAIDMLERVDEADWYMQRSLSVQALDGGEALQAMAYFGSAARLTTDIIHVGRVGAFSERHQALYRKPV
jgi:RimJ/RimL family protein N-acetyltransferase